MGIDADVQAQRVSAMAPMARQLLDMLTKESLDTTPYAQRTVALIYAAREFQAGLPNQEDVRLIGDALISLDKAAIDVVECIGRGENMDAYVVAYRGQLVKLLQLLKDALARHREAEELLRKIGDCFACKQPIAGGTYWLAEGTVYHKDCFRCSECSGGLSSYHSVEGVLYCPPCYAIWREKNSVKCGMCAKMIVGQHINTLGKRWHRECFRCTQCSKVLPVDFYNYQSMPFCSPECVSKRKYSIH